MTPQQIAYLKKFMTRPRFTVSADDDEESKTGQVPSLNMSQRGPVDVTPTTSRMPMERPSESPDFESPALRADPSRFPVVGSNLQQNPLYMQRMQQLNAMDQPQPEPQGFVNKLAKALEFSGRYGWMDPAKAQTLEQNRVQNIAENQEKRRTNIVNQLKMLQDEDYKNRELAIRNSLTAPSSVREYIYEKQLPPNEQEQFKQFRTRPGIERISGSMVTADDSKMLANQGYTFKDRLGNSIDVEQLPPHMGLALISGGTPGDPRYEIVTQPTRNVTMNNVTSVIPSRTPTAPIVQGTARVPTLTTREEVAIDPKTGEPVAQPLRTITTPMGAPSQTPTQQLSPVPTSGSMQQPSLPGNRQISAMPSAEIERQRKYAIPIKTAAVQIFGDPANPEFESLSSFAHLADDPASRQRVGRAARMILQSMTEAGDRGEGIGAVIAGYGASASTGGLWTWLKNKTGITGAIASSQAQATEAAVASLTPEEDRMLSRIFAAYGSISGLRTLTRGSAYQFSIQSLERELPIPGIANVQNSQSYYSKLASLAEEIATGVEGSGISKQILPQQDFYRQQAQQLTRLGQGQDGAQSVPAVAGTGDRIRVRNKRTGQTGTISRRAFDPRTYDPIP